jgi:hypothetical protein
MRTLVLQMDDRLEGDTALLQPSPDAQIRLTFTRHNRTVAQGRGCAYQFQPGGHQENPPWWRKVFAMRDVFSNDPEPHELLVLWMDSDAMLTDCGSLDPSGLATRYPKNCMWISPDAPPAQSGFNAGSFLVRGTNAGRALLWEWCSKYNPHNWVRRRQSERPTMSVREGLEKQGLDQPLWWQNTVGGWAGPAFEQGSFAESFLPAADRYGIVIMPYYVFNEVDCKRPHQHSITVHLYGSHASRKCSLPHLPCVYRAVHWKPVIWFVSGWIRPKKNTSSVSLY